MSEANTSGIPALRIHPSDNVAVAVRALKAGERVAVEGVSFVLERPANLGAKLALRPIRAGEQVVKYGEPIGRATRDIAVGEHVHTHNLRSDYLPTRPGERATDGAERVI